MRILSKIGILFGILVGVFSIWRWGMFYDVPYKMYIGIFVGLSIQFYSYLIDWMTFQDKKYQNLHKRLDSIAQELKTTKNFK